MTLQQQYDELYQRVHKAIDWLDLPERTREEIEKWLPEYQKLYVRMMKAESELKNETKPTFTRHT
jgi:hypothetical protein